MITLLGGKKKFTAQLYSFFSIKAINPNKHLGQEAMIGQYAHGNEPSHHIAYLYAYSENPEKGRKLISRIYNEFYNNTTTGMIGNDDCGQMSAWYIFSTLGFYPVNPSNATYVLGNPQVKNAVVHLGNNKKLTITNSSKNEIQLNNKIVKGPTILHKDLITGNVHLDFF